MGLNRRDACTALALSWCAISATAAQAQGAVDEPRRLADRTAEQIVRKDTAALYAAFSPKLKQAYTRHDLTAPLGVIQGMFGDIKSYRYKASTFGKRGVGKEWIRTVTYWYPAVTGKLERGAYLKVEITHEQGAFHVAGYSVERVLFGKEPPFLR